MKLSSMVIAVLGLASTTLACTASEGCVSTELGPFTTHSLN